MIWLAALAILPASPSAAVPEQTAPSAVSVQAQATIRVIRGARIHFGHPAHPDVPPQRHTLVKIDGAAREAKLIEFE